MEENRSIILPESQVFRGKDSTIAEGGVFSSCGEGAELDTDPASLISPLFQRQRSRAAGPDPLDTGRSVDLIEQFFL